MKTPMSAAVAAETNACFDVATWRALATLQPATVFQVVEDLAMQGRWEALRDLARTDVPKDPPDGLVQRLLEATIAMNCRWSAAIGVFHAWIDQAAAAPGGLEEIYKAVVREDHPHTLELVELMVRAGLDPFATTTGLGHTTQALLRCTVPGLKLDVLVDVLLPPTLEAVPVLQLVDSTQPELVTKAQAAAGRRSLLLDIAELTPSDSPTTEEMVRAARVVVGRMRTPTAQAALATELTGFLAALGAVVSHDDARYAAVLLAAGVELTPEGRQNLLTRSHRDSGGRDLDWLQVFVLREDDDHLLRECFAAVAAQGVDLAQADSDGHTLLNTAVDFRRTAAAAALLDRGIDPRRVDPLDTVGDTQAHARRQLAMDPGSKGLANLLPRIQALAARYQAQEALANTASASVARAAP